MKLTSIPVLACALSVLLSGAATADEQCYVIGDTSGNKLSKALGSNQNPYGSLADVEADDSCQRINVLYSEVPLDGGIALRDGQRLRGEPAGRAIDWPAVEALTPCGGVRIEDDVAVTATGTENFTRAAFAELAA